MCVCVLRLVGKQGTHEGHFEICTLDIGANLNAAKLPKFFGVTFNRYSLRRWHLCFTMLSMVEELYNFRSQIPNSCFTMFSVMEDFYNSVQNSRILFPNYHRELILLPA